ncbi:hypothetical protein I7I53_01984 [Histoplasma capsulatum var. duboisii H88]|uniref:Uncharacterized protein n=1 Tax=Ajellomyces capsulatus (strain H88) TaxID=544711 RepID=A0A8A1LLV5_AJEC8|nr:hypothetical protein I7I53_01984 [Histoplasma capsulatum var. duboisii H88]
MNLLPAVSTLPLPTGHHGRQGIGANAAKKGPYPGCSKIGWRGTTEALARAYCPCKSPMPHLHTAQWDEATLKASQFI